MPRESVDDKAARYILGRCVALTRLETERIEATVLGSRPYTVSYRPHRGWRCSCPTARARCSHSLAVSMVVSVPGPPVDQPRRTRNQEQHQEEGSS